MLPEILSLIAVGLVAGTIAAALGLGGGIIFVPTLVVLFGFEQHVAQGTSLAVIFPTAIVATIAHAKMGSVRMKIAVPIGLSFDGTPLPLAIGILVCAVLAFWLTSMIRRDSD